MKKNTLFIFVWLIVSLSLIAYTVVIREKAKRVTGITEAFETKISFDHSVEVVLVNGFPNKKIKKGDLLLQLRSPELEFSIQRHQMEIETKTQNLVDDLLQFETEKQEIISEKSIKMAELQSDAKYLEISIQNDEALAAGLNLQIEDSVFNPKLIKLNAAQQELVLVNRHFEQLLKISQLKYSVKQNSLTAELKNLEARLKFEIDKQKQLDVYASYDGVINNVNVEPFSKVEAYEVLYTYTTSSPRYVRAYADQDLKLNYPENTIVELISPMRKWVSSTGIVLTDSYRISDIPDRLKLEVFAPEWSQEFLIELPEDNEFLIGEKVFIK